MTAFETAASTGFPWVEREERVGWDTEFVVAGLLVYLVLPHFSDGLSSAELVEDQVRELCLRVVAFLCLPDDRLAQSNRLEIGP